jgi:hypoxanthine phosphoribosyltransferase
VAAEAIALDLGWPRLTELITALASDVAADGLPDLIVGVLRGGAVPAVLFAHRLGVRAIRAVEVTHTTADSPNAAKTSRPQVTNAASLGELAGLDVLIVDDVAGSGDTLVCARQLVYDARASRVRTTVCVLNEQNWTADDRHRPSYVGTYCRGWVRFPWETA